MKFERRLVSHSEFLNLISQRKTFIFFFLFLTFFHFSQAQVWTAKANYGGTARNRACAFSIPSIHTLYIVGGYDFTYEQDTWEYDTLTNAWTQKANFPGGPTTAVAFSINGKGYAGTGVNGGYVWYNSFYEYDAVANTWTAKANFPGGPRGYAVGFATSDKGYIGGGFTGTPGAFVWFNDFYEYDPVTDTWTMIANYPGAGAALGASGFCVNGKGYVGCGSSIDGYGNQTLHDDFYEYDPATNTWTAKANYAGGIRGEATSFAICDRGYIGNGYIVPHAVFQNDFWEYDPALDVWNAVPNFGGAARAYCPGSSIGKSGYAGTGSDGIVQMSDFWEYHKSYVADFSASSTSVCTGDSVAFTDLSNFNASSWSWNFPGGTPSFSSQQNPIVTYNTPGTYTATLTAYGCDSANITQNNLITVIAIPVTPHLGNDTLFCGNFLLHLNADSSGFQYLWSTGDTTQSIEVSSTDTFWVSIFNSCGNETDTIIIEQGITPVVFAGNDTTVCDSVNVLLNATGSTGNFLWSTGDVDSSILVTTAGAYWVSDSNICGTATDTVNLKLLLSPSVFLGNDTSLCDFSDFVLDAGSQGSYLWSTGEFDSAISIHAPGYYWVHVSNVCGESADTIFISPCEAEYLVPSAFTPNNDGVNDLLYLIKVGDASLIEFNIFNRWGQMVFETKNDAHGWDGKFNSINEEVGVFVYFLDYLDDKSGKEITITGNITLIR